MARALWAHRWFVLATVIACGIGGWQAARTLWGRAVLVDPVTRGALVETVVASGHVETPFRVEIGSQITGSVAEVLVNEGQMVARGQPLIALDARELQSVVSEAEGAVAQAEAGMRQLQMLTLPAARESLAQAQATLRNAQQTFDRVSALAPQGFESRASLDDARKNRDVAQTQMRAAELQVFSASPGGSEYVLATAQLNQARSILETALSRLNYATILAPRDGVLITRNVERGSVVQPGKVLLVLAPAGETQLVLQIDERNLGKIALGQPAVASADAFPDKRFDAVVSYINPGVDITRASVEVKLAVPSPPEYLRQDMTVSVDIEVARATDALSLPARSVREAMSGKPWVMTVRQGRASRQAVALGLRGDARFQITDGLKEGDVAIPATASMAVGQRLRPVLP